FRGTGWAPAGRRPWYGLVRTPDLAELARSRRLGGQHGKLGFDNSDIGLVVCIAQGFFSTLACFQSFGFVKVFSANSRIGQHRDRTWLDLEDTAGNEDADLGPVGLNDLDRSGPDTRDKRRVAGQYAQLAGLAGQRHEFRLTGKNRFFCTDDVNMQGGHV